MRVFIVDDSGVVRERLTAMLVKIEEIDMVGAADSFSPSSWKYYLAPLTRSEEKDP